MLDLKPSLAFEKLFLLINRVFVGYDSIFAAESEGLIHLTTYTDFCVYRDGSGNHDGLPFVFARIL